VSRAEALCRAHGARRDLVLVLCEGIRTDLARGEDVAASLAEAEALLGALTLGAGGRHGVELAAARRAAGARARGISLVAGEHPNDAPVATTRDR